MNRNCCTIWGTFHEDIETGEEREGGMLLTFTKRVGISFLSVTTFCLQKM
jgi:hypothetical protein